MALSRQSSIPGGQGSTAVALLLMLQVSLGLAQTKPAAEPEIQSLFPLGGRPGREFSATLRGRSLEGAHTLWFDSQDVSARVLELQNQVSTSSEEAEQGAATSPLQVLSVKIQLDRKAVPGPRSLRVITARGLSNPLNFWVYAEPDHREGQLSHDLAAQAEPLARYPLVVHGRIGQPGEVDHYSFRVLRDEWLRFEVHSLAISDMAMTLYEPAGSWFSPDRAKRLAFSDEPVSYPELTTKPVLSYRFEKSGQYLVRISSFLGEGGPDHSYLLRITRASDEMEAGASGVPTEVAGAGLWQERSWTRKLGADRMRALVQRTVPALSSKPEQAAGNSGEDGGPRWQEDIPTVDLDAASSGEAGPVAISLPVLLVGAIDHPGDIDRVRYSANVGDRIALEIETPQKTVPIFNPYLKLVDAQGAEVLTNVHSILNANNEIEKQIRPKAIHSFPRAGEFTLEIRDITAALGDSSMDYRVLVRPQVPHMGQIHVTEDHLNLVAGTATTLTLVTDQEEDFNGSIALSLSGLPDGVRALTATRAEPDVPPAVNEGRKERYVARSQKASFVMVAAPDAPPTGAPVTVRVMAQPVVEGRLGQATLVKDLLVMVVSPPQPSGQVASNPIEKTD